MPRNAVKRAFSRQLDNERKKARRNLNRLQKEFDNTPVALRGKREMLQRQIEDVQRAIDGSKGTHKGEYGQRALENLLDVNRQSTAIRSRKANVKQDASQIASFGVFINQSENKREFFASTQRLWDKQGVDRTKRYENILEGYRSRLMDNLMSNRGYTPLDAYNASQEITIWDIYYTVVDALELSDGLDDFDFTSESGGYNKINITDFIYQFRY